MSDDAPTYPTTIRARPWWVAWLLDGAERKRPVAPWETGHAYPVEWRGGLPDDERPETDFGTAERWVNFPLEDLGLALPDDALSDELRLGIILPVDRPPRDERIVLIDWDDVRDPETEEIHPVAAEFIDEYGGYVEISRSGKGLHQFVFGGLRHREKFIAPIDSEPFVGDDLPQVEIYDGGRHVAMTGDQLPGSDDDLVAGQDCIDTIVTEFAQAELDAGHRTYDPETGATPSDQDRADAENAVPSPVPEPEPCDYAGPPIDDLREGKPADRSLAYHAVVEAFCEGYAGVLNWRLEGAAAALGQREDRTAAEVIADLRGDGRGEGSVGYDRKTPGRVEYDHARAARDEFAPASWETLASWGVLPPEFVERVTEEGGAGPAAGGRYDVEVCEPPERDPVELDIDERRAELAGERLDDVLEDDQLHVWGDEAGVGKTTSSALGALDRGEDHAIYFDKHRKAREHVVDDAVPEWAEYYHLKGGEQKRDGVCMDADHARERGEDAECSEHGHPSDCPSMCPVYDLEPDSDVRQAYDAVSGELGPFRAHMVLGLTEDDEHLWHPEACAWMEQYDEVDSRANVAAVHPYLTQKTVREDRLNIADEAVDLHAEDRTLSVEDLTRMANALEDVADVQRRDEAAGYTLRGLASFARDLIDVITAADADPDEIAISRLSPPEIIWNAYETYNDVAGHHVAREEPSEGWHVAEAFADAKVEYGESVLARMHRDEWNGEPLSIDPLLATAATAGLPTDAVMKAVAAPAILETCPWCRSDVEHHNGARCCSDDGCGWNEREHTLTRKDGEQARATAWIDTDHDDRPIGLGYRALPLPSQLPDPGDTLALDATATPEKIAALFDVPTDEVVVSGDEDLELSNLRVTQVLDGQYHKGTITDALDEERTLADRIQRAIDTAGGVHRRPLFVVQKSLIPAFDFPENGEVMHYHATRGLNRADCDAVMCIGAPHPDVEDLKRNAELLATGREDLRVGGEEYSTRRDAPNPPVYRKLNYTDENGDGRAVPTKGYSGLVGTLFRENRENELEQAVHRIRPLLANDGETKHAYLLTNVPTDLPVDEVCSFEELADPLEAMLPVPEGAIDLLEAVRDVTAGDGPDGFRDPGRFIEQREDGTLANKVSGYHRLAQLSGMDVTERTVYNWVNALEDVGLLRPESYEQRRGVSYAVESSTLKAALSVLSGNVGFKVGAVRRFRALAEQADGSLAWLAWAREALGLRGDRCGWDPPPDAGV